ncbi:hypothetical protein CHU32_12860 [Superficieibacter electus]|uniref:Uncharacterized protein n=1 Tax=Superficieibacter electus TaxID=2022662 RepID=A0A2P5GPX6_9ENTR|nr:hypothetical protein [Superficieibacter electus]POP45301.1 hypothetical protein CHU33_09935 [Superficieibacter electus]POP48584.1 hypothetical protein CHU32_12860 [Superficieibacter electus]
MLAKEIKVSVYKILYEIIIPIIWSKCQHRLVRLVSDITNFFAVIAVTCFVAMVSRVSQAVRKLQRKF